MHAMSARVFGQHPTMLFSSAEAPSLQHLHANLDKKPPHSAHRHCSSERSCTSAQHCQRWHAEVDCAPAVGRWEVRIGLPGGRHVYLGLYPSEPEAARVYDRALVLLSGPAAATNFPTSNYQNEMALYAR